jgi:L-gulonate 3-dehydrogenase
MLVAHPVNPPHLISLVEIVPAPWTDADATARTRALMNRCGQSPVVLNKEINGFALNRLQFAVLGEAMRMVEDGVASPEDIDTVVKHGLAPRWSFMVRHC